MRYHHPRKNCRCCHGTGILLCEDTFDRDNGTHCPVCVKKAKSKKAKLVPIYSR